MKNVDIISKVVARRGEAMASPSKGAVPPVDLSGYLLKEIWDKVFEIRTDSNGTEYIFGKFPLVTQYGITMYAGNENLDIPSIYAGIPVDGTTIIKREDGTLMVNPNIELGGASNWDDLEGKPSWIGSTKPSYSYSEIEGAPDLGNYALKSDVTLLSEKLNDFLEGSDTDNIINKWKEFEVFLNGLNESDNLATILLTKADKTYVDGNFVTIGGIPQTITGEKNFTGGLKVNDSLIYYDTEKKYWKFEGDLLVTGGVTMYGNDSEFIPSTIMDAIQTDGVTIRVNPTTKNLEVIGNLNGATTLGGLSNVGTWADSVADVDRIMYQAAGSSSWVAKSLSSIGGGGGVSGDYLPLSGGTMQGSIDVADYNILSGGNPIFAIFNKGKDLYTSSTNLYLQNNVYYFDGSSVHSILHSGNYSSYALPLTGGTLSGALTFANNTWNPVGDDVAIGDCNAAGQLGIKALNTTYPGIAFHNQSGEVVGRLVSKNGILTWKDATVLHADNYSQYALPLTGGKISGTNTNVLDINSTNANEVGIRFMMSSDGKGWVGYLNSLGTYLYNNSSASYLSIKDDGSLYYSKGTIWHSGNDGSGSGLDADTIDGKHLSDLMKIKSLYDSDDDKLLSTKVWSAGITGKGDQPNQKECPTSYGMYISLQYDTSKNMGYQFYGNTANSTPTLYVRNRQAGDKNITYNAWKEIAFTDSNVASATKLQTARTIWGQSFDGTGNVDGRLVISSGAISGNTWASDYGQLLVYQGNTTSNRYCIGISSNTDGYCEIQSASVGIGAIPLVLQKLGGNVGIGTTTPTQPLHIVKSSTSQGDMIELQSKAGWCNIVYGATSGYKWSVGCNTSNQFYFWNNYLNDSAVIFYNNGGILAKGGITMYSDQRKKTILNHVELSLKQIADAPLIEHYYNSDDKRTTHVGSIAQYWASMNDWFCKLDSEGYYTMEIQNCALASAISIARELDRYETKTDKTINKLKKKIALLEEEVEQLRSRL